MRATLMTLVALGLLTRTSAAQWYTGEARLQAIAGVSPAVSGAGDYNEFRGPPSQASMVGLAGDLSFISGNFRLGPEGFVLRGATRRVWGLGGVARYEMGRGRVRPYGMLGAGAYFWERLDLIEFPPEYGGSYSAWGGDVDYFSVNAGIGMAVGAPGGQLAFIAELRGHRSLEPGGGAGARALVTVGVGGRIAW